MTRWAGLVWSYPCPTCGVGPGTNCRTTSRHVKPEPHTARVESVARCTACRQWIHADAADAGVDRCEACLAKMSRER